MVKAVFLDRDGTINKLIHGRPDPKHVGPWKFEEFEYIDGVRQAVKKLRNLGFTLHVVTNQPDVKDGLMDIDTLYMMHEKLKNDLNVDTIQYCSNRDSIDYKPKTGMLDVIISKWHITKERSWMIGDSWKDIVAGHTAGLTTIYLGDVWDRPPHYCDVFPDFIAKDLLEATVIIEQNEAGR